jgi:hypothetical protein
MFVVLRDKDEEMEQKSTLGGHVETGVDSLIGDALREALVPHRRRLLTGCLRAGYNFVIGSRCLALVRRSGP